MSGVVRVGLPLAVASVLHADGIDEFWQNYPNIRIESVSHYQSPNLNVLDVDLGFMLEPPSGSDLVIVESKVIGCSFVAAPSYLAKYGEPKDLEDLIQNHRICGKLINYRYLKEWKDIMSRGLTSVLPQTLTILLPMLSAAVAALELWFTMKPAIRI